MYPQGYSPTPSDIRRGEKHLHARRYSCWGNHIRIGPVYNTQCLVSLPTVPASVQMHRSTPGKTDVVTASINDPIPKSVSIVSTLKVFSQLTGQNNSVTLYADSSMDGLLMGCFRHPCFSGYIFGIKEHRLLVLAFPCWWMSIAVSLLLSPRSVSDEAGECPWR